MIFSLSEKPNPILLEAKTGVDIFCFFETSPSIHCPAELWFSAVCSSLRMKHEVLLLEESVSVLPQWEQRKRWDSGENWCWLSPRSLSVISGAYEQMPLNFQEFKAFLKSSK